MTIDNSHDAITGQPSPLTVLVRNGQPAMAIRVNPARSVANDRQRIRELRRKAAAAPTGDTTTPYGYIAFMGRRHISRMQDLMEARRDDWHKSAWVQDVDGIECTACTCGVLVPASVGTDFTEEQFRAADGHLPYEEPEKDLLTCPRCGHGLPSDRDPGSGSGFWSLTVPLGYVCEACHNHQMHLGYSPRNLGDEDWPVNVPQRFYDEAWWPERTPSRDGGVDHA